MLYKIDFTGRNERKSGTKWINYVADSTEATKIFMESFFSENPGDAVRIDHITEVELTGDLSGVEIIDAQLSRNQ